MRNFLPLKFRDDIGHLAENVVFGALRRQELPAIHFWRSKSDAEVDFVYEQGGQLCPVEVKYVNNPVVGKSLHAFIERYNPTQVIIATKNIWAEDKIGECKIFFRPAFYL